MSSIGDQPTKSLSTSPHSVLSDVDALHVVTEAYEFDAVVLTLSNDGQPIVRASWPVNLAGQSCEDSTESGRKSLLIAAGGSALNVVSVGAKVDSNSVTTIHGSLPLDTRFPLNLTERALQGVAQIFALKMGADIARQRAEDLHTHLTGLVDLSLALGQEVSLKSLLLRIVESARLMIGARYAALGVLEAAGTGLGQIVTAGLSLEQQAAIGGLPQGHGILGALMRDAQVLRLDHLADDPRSVGFPLHHPQMDSFLGVPIIIHNVVLGSLYFTDKENGPFSADDEIVAVAFALQAAVAVENVRIFEAEYNRAEMLESVHEIENAIHATSGTQQALDVLCSMLGERLGVDRVKTNTVGGDHEVKFGAQWYLPSQQPHRNTLDDLSPHAGQVVDDLWQISGLRVIDDFDSSQDLSEGSRIFHEFTGAHAAIIAPIELGGRIIGVIYVIMNHKSRHWSEFEIELVKRVARFVARVIEDEEYRVHQSAHIEQLERLKRLQSNFVATVSHELRTPLTSIIGYLELLRGSDGRHGCEFSTDQLRMLEVMDRNSVRLRKLIEDLLVLNQREGDFDKGEVTQVNMRDLIIETCQELSLVAQRGSISLDIEAISGEAIVSGDRGQLKSAVVNIVSNAIKFSRLGTEVAIRCEIDRDNHRVQFKCQDSGIGIPPDDQKQLFNRFYRASNAARAEIPGTGLGLSIVKQIVEEHGGEVRLTSVEGEGTTVVVDLPLSTTPQI